MKILVIRFSSIGDIILCTPVIRCAKLQLNGEVHFLTGEKSKQILQSNPYIDKTITYNGYWATIKLLKQQKYDIVIDLHKSRLSRMITMMLPTKIFSFDKLNLRKWLYVQFKWNTLPEKHLVDRYFEGIKTIPIKNDERGLDYFYDESEPTLNIEKYNVLVLGAAHATKRIPIEIASSIIRQSTLPIVLLGGQDVIAQADILAQQCENAIHLVGKTSLQQAAQLIHNSNYIWTGDTGLMHMAAALKKPITVVWGNTLPAFGMYPYYGANNDIAYESKEVLGLSCRPCSKLGFQSCPQGHFKCMNGHKF